MLDVSPLRSEDAKEMVSLSARAFERGFTEAEVEEEVARGIAVALGARYEGLLVGFSIAWVVADECELHAIAVDPTMRRAGIGAALLRATRAEALARGAHQLHLEVRADNAAALNMYTHAGLTEVGRRVAYYGDGTDALLVAGPTG